MQDEKVIEKGAATKQPEFGKFNTAVELLEAYNALEKEFTKRCQLVKQLQADIESLRAQVQTVSHDGINAEASIIKSSEEVTADNAENAAAPDNFGKTEFDKAQAETLVQPTENNGGSEVAANTAQCVCGVAESAAVIPSAFSKAAVLEEVANNACEYADELSAVPEIMDACIARYKQRLIEFRNVSSPSGMAVIVPAKKPKTLSEAKLLADAMLS